MTPSRPNLDFFRDLRDVVLARLRGAGFSLPKLKGTTHKQCFDALYTLDNVLRRRIEPRRRAFKLSSAASAGIRTAPVLKGLERLQRAVTAGEDLSPWLSTKIEGALSKDGMLFDWGIHHLHLSTVEAGQGFRARTDDLVFAVVRPDAFLVLDVGIHDDIGDKRLLEILLKDWPELLRGRGMRGILAGKDPTPAEMRDAWRAGVQPAIGLSDGNVYAMIGGGVNTTGRSAEAVRGVDNVLIRVRELQEKVTANVARYVDYIDATSGKKVASPIIRLEVNQDLSVLRVFEQNTGVHFPFGFEGS